MQVQKLITTALVAMILGWTVSAHAQQDGSWINLFDGETLFGWTTLGDAKWTVKDGAIAASEGTGGVIATTSRFQDFELTASVRLKPGCTAGILFRGSLEGHPSESGSGVVWLSTPKDGAAEWRQIRVIAKGDDVQTAGGDSTSAGTNSAGRIGLLYHHNNGTEVAIKDVKLRPLGLNPLFNGKDLTGWNTIPDHKSVFSVVDGALNIKNGNGQIETAKTFRDFTLQLDIISNGEHLNSGVFFRTPPGVFWKGYESQVRNQWRGDDRTMPVDYGTGGNYGNQAARKVVPSDHEWFTKTIVADGNHAAVWINGYQVSDYTDMRAVNEGADGKVGYVANAGTINLQGHDPTTDLSFKNILIQEYK
jgi:hypothetical protein